MQPELSDDLKSSELLFSTYLHSANCHRSPLSESNKQNVQVHHSKQFWNLENHAKRVIELVIREDVRGDNCMFENERVLAVVSNGFKCLYHIFASAFEYTETIKKHQVFIIKLIESKRLDVAFDEIIELRQVLDILANVTSRTRGADINVISLLAGIEFNQTYIECLNETPKKQLTSLILAFHFLCIQCSLQKFSIHIKDVLLKRDHVINLDNFSAIPSYFLSNGNFFKWLNYSFNTICNKERALNNLMKMLNGYLKISSILISKTKGHDLDVAKRTNALFTLKLLHVKLMQNNMYQIDSELPVMILSHLKPFIDDIMDELDASIIDQRDQFLRMKQYREQVENSNIITETFTSPVSVNDLTKQLAGVSSSTLSENLKAFFLSDNKDYLKMAKDKVFLASINDMIKRFSILESNTLFELKILLTYFSNAFKVTKGLFKNHIIVLDSITVLIKRIVESQKALDALQLTDTIEKLHAIFSQYGQLNRIRNLSSILYMFAKDNKEGSSGCLKLSIQYEMLIFKGNEEHRNEKNLTQMMSKLQTYIKQTENRSFCGKILYQILALIDGKQNTLMGLLNDIRHFKFNDIIPTVAQCLLDTDTSLYFIGRHSNLSDSLKCLLVIKSLEYLNNSDDIDDKVFDAEKVYYMFHTNTMKFKEVLEYHWSIENASAPALSSMDWNSEDPISHLLYCGILVQRTMKEGFNSANFLQLSQKFIDWSERCDLPSNIVEGYEHDIIETIINYGMYHQMYDDLVHMIKTYLENRTNGCQGFQSIFIEYDLLLKLCEISINVNEPSEASDYLTMSGNKIKELASSEKQREKDMCLMNKDLMKWKLLQLEYCLIVKNDILAIEKFKTTLKFMRSKTDFNLKISGRTTLKAKLETLLIIAKFQFLTSSLNSRMNNYVNALSNIKVAIKISKSVMQKTCKKLGKVNIDIIRWDASTILFKSYRQAISFCMHLGIVRDLPYYLNELTKLADEDSKSVKKCIAYFELSINYSLMGNKETAWTCLSQGENTFDHLNLRDTTYEILKEHAIILYHANILRNNQHSKLHGQSIVEIMNHKQYMEDIHSRSSKISDTVTMLNRSKSAYFNMDQDHLRYSHLLSCFYYDAFSEVPLPTTISNSREDILKAILWAKQVTYDAKKKLLHSSNSLSQNRVFAFPSMHVESHLADGNSESSKFPKVDMLNDLVKAKELIISLSQSEVLMSLACHEIDDLSKLLCDCLSILYTYTSWNRCELTESNSVLWDLYFTFDLHKYLPFAYDLFSRAVQGNVSDNALLPNEIEKSPLEYGRSELMLAKIKEMLPKGYCVATIDTCPISGDLILSKLMSDFNEPFFLRIGSSRFSSVTKSQKLTSFGEIKSYLKSIISRSNSTTSPEMTSQVQTRDDRKTWWKIRFALDLELQELLTCLETDFFCAFRGFFSTRRLPQQTLHSFKDDLIDVLSSSIKNGFEISANDINFDFEDPFLETLLNSVILVYSEPTSNWYSEQKQNLLDDALNFFEISLHYKVDAEFHRSDALSKRLDGLFEKYSHILTCMSLNSSKKTEDQEHLIIVPGGECTEFPWESLPCLQGISVSRMPSLNLLHDLFINNTSVGISLDKAYYIINPGSDLPRTEKKFGEIFKQNRMWEGSVGIKPEEGVIVQNLKTSSLFVYLGHGGCEQYIRSSSILKDFSRIENNNLPPSLLIGCSSGAVSTSGLMEPNGQIYTWLSCGSPMVLANLWDVTDKDIDSFSASVFEKWGLLYSSDSMKVQNSSQAVLASRSCCVLRFLNGSAPIVYGIPLITQKPNSLLT
ncbi:Piso0_002067 [Millerozyma farinosa CBS 7064]|uniref:separase n=1 Tax=Pichia sorbitophila (strain ATCC MYA-4447 / BCRC 22081 / CBS 7064 / NBRC 10061 / NRRL Y-12695) TaxID=559304 RepID=G8YBL5_PICSO|nr:Piso0_002067 [Millerozyma farinosa CBS 7064]